MLSHRIIKYQIIFIIENILS